MPTILAGGLLSLLAGIAGAQVVRSDLWTTDGTVRAATLSGSTLYLGGTFTYVGPRTGGGIPIDTTSGAPTGFPRVEGTVNVAIPDGFGGWYVGGQFSSVGGRPRQNLVHVTSTDLVDPGFAPNPSAAVTALALDGSTLYVAGGFAVIGGQSRTRAAALDVTNGSVLSGWVPSPNNLINTLVVVGSTLYAGGQFTIISGQSRSQIAAFQVPSGTLLGWNPGANGPVRAIVPLGPNLYVGGGFSIIGGRSRNWLAALDPASDSSLAWNPNPVIGVGNGVAALVARGTTLYTAGSFTTISAQARNGMAAIDTAGTLATWNPNPNQIVNALAVNGPTIYAGGAFTSIGGQTRFRMAALDAVSGLATGWTAHASDHVDVLALAGSNLFVGGAFNSLGGVPRTNIAALDLVSGTATAFNPGASSVVRAFALSASTLYAGGDFTQIGGQTRGRLAAFNLADGSLLPWNPNSNTNGIYTLAFGGPVVYAGGSIGFIDGQTRSGLAAIDASSGHVTGWNPNATGGPALALIVSGPTVYVAGNFTNVGGQPRNFIAALDTMTGNALTGFNPNANNGINALALRDSTLYAGGFFTTIGGQTRNRIAAVHAVTGTVTPWNPNATSASVSAITLDQGAVYAGGGFTTIGGQPRNNLAALDAATGLATTWNPNANSSTFALSTGSDVIFAGGQFTTMGTLPGSSAAINASCPPPLVVRDTSATLGSPMATAAGDFDGDGALDVAAAVVDGAQVMRNQGTGHFASLSSTSLGAPGRGIAASDFNYDFALDLVVSTATAVHVMLGLKSNGVPTGGFGSPTSYVVGANPASIAVSDFNEDGIPDLAVAVTGANSVKVLLGNGTSGIGNGTFAAPTSFAVGSGPQAVAIADFNADGIWDMAVSDSAGNAVSVLLGQGSGGVGNGSFASAVNYTVANGPRPIVTGDFNEDGVADLAVGTSNSVDVLLGNASGNGTFAAANHNTVGGGVSDLIAADFDGDGRVDLGATLGALGTFQYLYGDGSSVVGNGAFLLGLAVPIGGTLSALKYGAFDPGDPGGSVVVARADQGALVSVGSPCAPPTPPLLEMMYPNGGETCDLGTAVPLQWARNEVVSTVHVEVSRDNGAHWNRIASNLTGTEFRWTAAPPGSTAGRVRIVDAQRLGVSDASNGSFRMQPLVGVDSRPVARPSFSSAYPNPMRGSVRFDVRMPAAGTITVEVFDLAGRRVHTLQNGPLSAGDHVLIWNGRTPAGRAPDGVYFVRARMPGLEAVRRVVRIAG